MLNTVNLQVWMCNNKVSHNDLARRIGVCRSTITGWLNGRTEIPLWAAMKIEKIAKVSLQELFRLEETE